MRPPVALRPHDLVSRALEMMTSMGVRELPVVDGDRRVLGLVDEASIAREFMRARAAERADAAASGVRPAGPGEPE
jgi:predicted transcriptional regulator